MEVVRKGKKKPNQGPQNSSEQREREETMILLHLWKHQLRKDKKAGPSQSLHTVPCTVNLSFHFWITLFWTTMNISQMAAVSFALLKVQALTMI